jgi:uncharacterized protein (TIGR02996 family)
MSDETGFLHAIQAAPSDRTVKLVYADWLDEHGEYEKAEYLRIVCRANPQQRMPDADARRMYELEVRHHAWADLLQGIPPLLDPHKMFLLGRLQGLLSCCANLSAHESDIAYDFTATLRARTGPLADLMTAWVGQDYAPVALEPMADWEADLRGVLTDWLFRELRRLRNGAHIRLAFLADRGREGLVAEVTACIREVITPITGWRMHITRGNRFYALDWADVVLEADDRVLWMHFSFSD